ncbi:cupin domain-containing protein [Blastococcus sp. CT_GayMR20]|uniref:cupin domain-containing protein n=1 Tax=Blastococcus sp. CT_GayMR20 TaxID=2559609 RepID=UPI001073F15A|nr:cupin domain-containing protein [Blastococcus sp. CT_GayMR20]TFV81108.1 cupin domain-containing protein [Blastococcus sp. CT_GayMR20]
MQEALQPNRPLAAAGPSGTEPQKVLRSRVEAHSLVSLWDNMEDVVSSTTEKFVPHVWRWDDIREVLMAAGDIVSLEEADRRALILANPGVFPKYFTTNNLYVAYQLVRPGETAAVHRHTPSASRFVLEGNGGYTVVEGEKCPMQRGDLILTPQGTWHDHGNDGEAPAIWVDVLDLPIVDHQGAIHFDFVYGEADHGGGEPIRKYSQSIRTEIGYSTSLYGTGGMQPAYVDSKRGDGIGSPQFVYPWEATYAALNRLRDHEGSPFDGIVLRYTDPTTGGPISPTMDFTVQLLRAGEATKSHRHTSSTSYTCIQGSGETIVDGQVMSWGENDTFVLPSWCWHSHQNHSATEDAILYAVSDLPISVKLGLYREQAEGEPDGAWRGRPGTYERRQ